MQSATSALPAEQFPEKKSPKKKSVDQIFETEKRGKLFYCTHPDLKGYYLDENQYTRHIPGLNGGLRLTNGHETKIIFPSYHIKHTDDVAALLNKNSEEDKAVLMPSYKFSSEQIPNLPPFLIYDESELILERFQPFQRRHVVLLGLLKLHSKYVTIHHTVCLFCVHLL